MTDQPIADQPFSRPARADPPERDRTTTQQPTSLGEHATGDIVIDAALQDLQNAPGDDLDAQLEAGAAVSTQTLQGRLSDLGGA